MKTKIIPFDAKMAKDIQDGKIKGRVRTIGGDFTARIICFDKIKLVHGDGTTEKQIVSLIYNENAREDIMYVHNQKGEVQATFGWEHGYDLVLEVPDNEPQEPQFKVGDKVRVRPNDTHSHFVKQYDNCIGKIVGTHHEYFVVIVTGAFQDQFIADELELVEETGKHEFKPFDKVLVRSEETGYCIWQAAFYSHFVINKGNGYHITTAGDLYLDGEIIPYAGNENLVGTDKPKEE